MSDSSNRANFIKLVQKKVLQNHAQAIRDTNELERELKKVYKKAGEEIKAEINSLMSNMNEWSMVEASKFARLNKLIERINKIADGLGRDEVSLTSSHLRDTFQDRYLRDVYTLGQFIDVKLDLTLINPKRIEEAINYPWSGAMFSERIWDNRDKLVKNIREGVTQSLVLGESMQKIANRINKGIDNSNFNALRVARTETMRVCYVADRKAYESEGIQKVQFNAYLDHRTSDYCRGHDDKEYVLGSEPMLPAHPHCRSTYIPILPSIDYGEGIVRKNKGGKLVEESNNYEEFRDSALESRNLENKYNGQVGKNIALSFQKEYNDRQKNYLNSIAEYNDRTLERVDKMLNDASIELADKERKKLLELKNDILRNNKILIDRELNIFDIADSKTNKIKYSRGGRTSEVIYYSYPVELYEEKSGGKYFIHYAQKVTKKEMEQIEGDIANFLKKNPRATGIKIRVDNKDLDNKSAKSRGITMGYYQPSNDKIVMRTYKGYEAIYKKKWNSTCNGKKEFLETFSHELGHRVHSDYPLMKDMVMKDDEWKEWVNLVEPFYESYRVEKKIDIQREWHRFEYPVNAQDYYRDKDKSHFYQEMWAESSSVLHTEGEGIDREKEVSKLDKYFPKIREFVEKIYSK